MTFWNFYFQLHPGTIKTPQVIEFLQALRRQIRQPLLIVWDRLPAHRSAPVRRYVESSQGRLVTAFLPAYAPELNPVEYLWAVSVRPTFQLPTSRWSVRGFDARGCVVSVVECGQGAKTTMGRIVSAVYRHRQSRDQASRS